MHKCGVGASVHTCAQRYFRHLARGIRHCHDHNIAHLDVKPNNCLLGGADGPDILKLAEFGSSWDLDYGVAEGTFGSPFWRCPEGVPDRAADIWSCGCVLFAMLDGTYAFTEKASPLPADGGSTSRPDAAVQERACFEGRAWWEYQLPATFPPEAADLVYKALQPRRSRIEATEVERHAWCRHAG